MAQEIQEERNPNRHGSQKAPLAGGQFCETQKSSSSAPIVDTSEYPITASYSLLGGRLHYFAPVKHRDWKNIGLVIERLLTPGSISGLVMRRFVLGKDTLRLFSIWIQHSTRCGGPADERHKNRAQKSALHYSGYRLAQST